MQAETLFDPEPEKRHPYQEVDYYTPPPKRTPTYWKPSASAVARRFDPAESHAAAKSVTDLTGKQQAVYDCLVHAAGPLTDYGIAACYQGNREQYDWPEQSASGLRTRRSELVAAGMVKRAGTAKLPTGRNAATWEPA
jgi:hypothetical protein